MRFSRKIAKYIIESLTGLEIEVFGHKIYGLTHTQRRADVWFSYHSQVRSILEKQEINLVIDVGANEGQFARKIRSFYLGEIFSFEPVSTVFEKLAIAASSDSNWHVNKLALGSRNQLK